MDLPQVSVHPLVLLSIVDHYRRVVSANTTNTSKRVVGVLLGQWLGGGQVSLTNSYALPFEENPNDPTVWFLDHNYHETMAELFKKVNAKERVVGWYHSGPRLRASDLLINQVFRRYCHAKPPILLIADPHQREALCAYQAVEEILEDGTAHQRTWAHLPLRLEAEEAEEIGVEHLLRDVAEGEALMPRGSAAERLVGQREGLRAMAAGLSEMCEYLGRVEKGEMPPSPTILKQLQELVNGLPLPQPELTHALTLAANDHLAAVWTGSLIRSVIALHTLIDNKLKEQ